MAHIVRKVSSAESEQILRLDESHFLDFKAKEIAPAKLTQTLSGFANAEGGEVYVGISDQEHRVWAGFDTTEAANGLLQAVNDQFPFLECLSLQWLEASSARGLVLHIQVQKTRDIRYASNRIPYVRVGAQNQPVQDAALDRLKLNKGLVSFEDQLVPADPSVILDSPELARFMENVVPRAEPETWVKKQQLLRDDKPTVAGLLLFGEEPQVFLPKRSAIKIYRYKTSEDQGTRETLAFDPLTVEGSAYKQIYEAVAKTVDIIQNISILGPTGLETARYPRETLHEIITNAALHRDYSIADDIDVRIFDNRIEVESPGRLPGHITVSNILSEQFARNPALVRLINKFPNPPNKDVGEGLNTAFEAMRKLQLRAPEIKEGEHSVIVYIRHEPLASAEEIVMEYLESHPSISNSIGRQICHIGSENVMKKVFERMMERGMIERVPGKEGRAAAYQKKMAGPPP